jgi:hypothetical protein
MRQMGKSSLPLLCRAEFRPDESLLSLLTRLTELNCYGSFQNLARWCLSGSKDDEGQPSQVDTFERVASLTKIPWPTLYDATAHRFTGTLVPPGTQTESLDLPSGKTVSLLPPWVAFEQLRPVSAGQFCPRCLEESVYHRVNWVPVAVSACLQHGCLLLDHCPGCWHPVTIQDIAESCCARCGFDLAQGSSPSIEGDTWGQFSQQIIQAWLGIVPMPAKTQSYSLPDQPPAVLYHVLDGLRQSITGVRVNWKYLHRIPCTAQYSAPAPDDPIPYQGADVWSLLFDRTLTTEESYCLYATAFKGIVNWPTGFHEFLRAYSLRNVVQFSSQLCTDFDELYSEWLQRHWKRLSFVQDAFCQYLVDRYALSPSVAQPGSCRDGLASPKSPAYVTTDEAARLLEVSPKTVNRFVEAGLLFRYKFPGYYEFPRYVEEIHYDLIRRIEVMQLRDRWANGVSLDDAIRWLGLPEQIVLGLVKADLLFAEHGPDVDGSRCWTFSKQAVTECYYEVTKNLRRYAPEAAVIDLAEAARILSPLELDGVGILKRVARGRLACYVSLDSCGLRRMMFTAGDIRAVLEASKAEKKWMNYKEVAKRMGVKESSVHHWIESGLLVPTAACGGAYYFDQDVAEEFITGHVFIDKAAQIAGVAVGVVREWVRNGWLKPVSGPKVDFYYRNLFRCGDVEQLRSPSSCNRPQSSSDLPHDEPPGDDLHDDTSIA